MCVLEEGDVKAIWGGVSSIIHQLVDQTRPPIYLPLQGALLLWLCLSMLTPPSLSSLSLLRMDEGECAARNPEHRSRQRLAALTRGSAFQ